MKKILVIPNSYDNLGEVLKTNIDGIILPIKGLSVNSNISFTEYPIWYSNTEEKTSTIFLAIVDNRINILYLLILVMLSPFIIMYFL